MNIRIDMTKQLMCGVCLLLMSVWVSANANASSAIIEYDKTQDLLTVKVQDASLKYILGRIAILTSMEVQMHPEAEQQVSFDIKQQELQSALQSMLKALNTVLVYGSAPSQPDRKILIAMHILPKGEYDESGLQPIVNIAGEVFIHQKRLAHQSDRARPPRDRASILEISDMRWRARLAKLPEQEREELLERAQNRIDKQAAQKAKRKAKSAERKAVAEKNREEKLAKQQVKLEALKQRDPDGYEVRLQQREAAKQQMLDEIAAQQ